MEPRRSPRKFSFNFQMFAECKTLTFILSFPRFFLLEIIIIRAKSLRFSQNAKLLFAYCETELGEKEFLTLTLCLAVRNDIVINCRQQIRSRSLNRAKCPALKRIKADVVNSEGYFALH